MSAVDLFNEKEPFCGAGAGKKGYTPFQRSESLKEKRRSAKPANLDAAQDWYWIEEFPRGSGIEPGTGNMSTWFHGEPISFPSGRSAPFSLL